MAKILHFPDPKDDQESAIDWLKDSTESILEEGQVESMMIACKLKDRRVITGRYNCDFSKQLELDGHIKCDIIDQMIRANPERY